MVDILKTGVEQFPVVLTASGFDISPYQKGPYTYLWTFDDGSQLTGAVVSYTWKAAGYKIVALKVTDSFSGLSSNFNFTVRIISLAEVLREISISPTSVSLNINDTQQFTATVPYGIPDLVWTAVDGTVDSTGLFTATTDGTGSVTVALAGNPAINASAVVTIPIPG